MTETLIALDMAPLTNASVAMRMLTDARRWVEESNDADALLDAIQKAQLAREWVRIVKEAAAIGAEATRLEMTALRRCGQIGCVDQLPVHQRQAARGFAEMSDAEFATLMASTRCASVASTVWRTWRQDQEEADAYDRGYLIGSGQQSGGPVEIAPHEVSDAARIVLGAALNGQKGVSVGQASLALADALDISRADYFANDAMRKGLRTAIRAALASEYGLRSSDNGLPDFISYQEEEMGWIVLPFAVANVTQVAAWAAFRNQQADDVRRAADEAMSLAERVVTLHETYPDINKAIDLLARRKDRT